MADKLQQFISVAQQHVGGNGDWAWSTSPLARGYAWCAAYVRSCALTVGGIDGVVMSTYNDCHGFAMATVNSGQGIYLPAPNMGGHPVPQVGDLIFFRWVNSSKSYYDNFVSDHIGIVVEVYSDAVYTIEGNTMSGGKGALYSIATKKSYNINDTQIRFYVRPNWSKIGCSTYNCYGNFPNKKSDVGGVTAVLSTSPDGTYTQEIQTHIRALGNTVQQQTTTVPTQSQGIISTIIPTTVEHVSSKTYSEPSGKEDAMVREVAYFGYDYKPSMQSNPNKISIINLTLYNDIASNVSSYQEVEIKSQTNSSSITAVKSSKGVAQSSGTTSNTISYQSNFNNVPTNASAIIQYLMNKGFNCASAVGLTANIYYESNYNPSAIGDKGTSFGLCQWHNTSYFKFGDMMKQYANASGSWEKNVSGQLDFLVYTLSEGFRSTSTAQSNEFFYIYKHLMSVPNTLAGAMNSADFFVRNYERPPSIDAESAKRQAKAKELWTLLQNQLVSR